MVEVDIQFLAGVAATVFLALMFFGVVVLWDVALALRGVGDKIDKLEDNLDDDLKDIGHSIDGMGGMGGGGAQVHLSGGGTISSGPPQQEATQTGQQHGPAPAQSGADGAHKGPGAGGVEAPRQAHADRATASVAPGGETVKSEQGPYPQHPGPTETHRRRETPPERGTEDPGRTERVREWDGDEDATPAGEESATDASSDEEGPADDDEADGDHQTADHPMAERNRGRFVTSPDRTPWYATTIDREAIADLRDGIAGELEAGSSDRSAGPDTAEGDSDDESPEVIAAGPAGAATTEPIAVGPDGPDAGDPESDDDEIATDADVDADDANDDPTDGEAAPDEEDEGVASEDEDENEDGAEDDESTAAAAGDETDGDIDPTDDRATDDGTDDSDDGSDDVEAVTGDDVPGTVGDADDAENGDADDVGADDEDADVADDTDVDPSGETDDASDGRDDADDADDESAAGTTDADDGSTSDEVLADDGVTFEFDQEAAFDVEPEESEEDLTAEEAVEAVNEEEPALSRSSHGVESGAESDEEGAVLTFEFDPSTADVGDSTKRLLRYQLRSFADKESTPDVDVTVQGSRIVVDIPEADGTAVTQWERAVVEAIDRTMFLSDNGD